MAAVGEKFGAPWRVEERPGGFAAILDLRTKAARFNPTALPDDVIIEVQVDEAARVFSYDANRVAGGTRESESRGPLSYSKSVDSKNYRGKRMSFSFKRTPEGLVPDTDDPFNTTAKEAQLVALGRSLGLTLDEAQAPAFALRVSTMPSKKMLIAVAVGFGVVILGIIAVVVTIFASVFSRLAG